ncbi:hypothetical protein GQX74_003953 [Glossina fuscipes]|nr:hypothetical protein GQX74_003953 [Glossina fuscipes]
MKEDMLNRIPLATQRRAGNNFDIELEEFHRLIDNEFLYMETTHTAANLPMHTPRPLEIGSFMTHCKGDSHCPENSPGPPQVSPKSGINKHYVYYYGFAEKKNFPHIILESMSCFQKSQ